MLVRALLLLPALALINASSLSDRFSTNLQCIDGCFKDLNKCTAAQLGAAQQCLEHQCGNVDVGTAMKLAVDICDDSEDDFEYFESAFKLIRAPLVARAPQAALSSLAGEASSVIASFTASAEASASSPASMASRSMSMAAASARPSSAAAMASSAHSSSHSASSAASHAASSASGAAAKSASATSKAAASASATKKSGAMPTGSVGKGLLAGAAVFGAAVAVL